NLNEPAPPTGLDIISGYPIDIENTLDAGYKVQKSYTIKATKSGNYTILPTIINYKSESGKGYSSESESLNIVVKEPEIKLPNLITVINVDKTELVVGNRTTVSVKVTNTGKASAKDVKIDASVPEGLKIVSGDLETVFPEIKPGESKGYLINPVLEAVKNGTYIIYLKTVYSDKENTSESPKIIVLEKKPEKNKDNKFMYLLILIPIILVIAWIYKVHRDYRY
ncbi:MAG: CARDB domain-containing protein, partial [Methanosarcinales archaeon]